MNYITITFVKKRSHWDTKVIPSLTPFLITQALLSVFKLRRCRVGVKLGVGGVCLSYFSRTIVTPCGKFLY